MKGNLGNLDSVLRLAIAAILVGLYVADIVSGVLGISLLVIAGILCLTSIISFCPLYAACGLNSSGRKKPAA